MPEIANGDVKLWYAERGQPGGLPVVMLHGLFFSRRLFERLADRLPSHRFLLLDLRGHGRSSRPADVGSYSWRLMASDVARLLDVLEVEQAVVGGLSLGADVTLAFAACHPGRLAGAIVEMPVLDAGRPTAERVFRPLSRLLGGLGESMRPVAAASGRLRRLRQPEVAAAADLLSLEPAAGSAMLRGLMDNQDDVRSGPAALAAGAVPTLVIAHRHDPMHPVDDARTVADAVPGARLEVVSSMAELRLRPGRYAEIIGGFLREIA
ncbi:MAG TPA: alpha/beta fold hydrolase [Acidimicrobiales bacterium]|nr:alpha/beta fold hydrolase [Acidimicrobiales bacterium]